MTVRSLQIWRGAAARSVVGIGTILLVVGLLLSMGALRPLDDLFDGLRFRAVRADASRTLTIVEIDARSLQTAGTWPWGRERYAKVVDRLTEAGATFVAFDVDFSASSNDASDKALADAISRHPGQVALGTFVQNDSYGAGRGRVLENRPIDPLMRDALLASVNVPVDRDGVVRRYDRQSPSGRHPSVAATLAGANQVGDFAIDYGIDHHTLSHLSFGDVLDGRFDPALVKGRVILIGATALELGDEFATPVGLLPGVVIHGLAYESIVGGRALLTLQGWVLLALCLGLGLSLMPERDGGRRLGFLMLRHALAGVCIFGLPVLLQALAPITIRIAPLLVTQLLFAVWATRVELARRARMILKEREAGLLHLAMHQPETELPNRRALLQQITDAWTLNPEAPMCVVTIGVERHAEMRGVVGYGVANHLITQLADRLAQLADVEIVAHISSSVLAFSRPGMNAADRDALLDRLLALETNFQVDEHSIDIYLRLGAVIDHRREGVSPEILVERATLALNRARGSVGRVAVYDEATFGSPANNLALMSEMLEALASGDIALHYQPKMRTTDGVITSVEALCRWRHPVRGNLSPDLFIPIAEETGQIRALTEWSFIQVIKDQERLRTAGHDLTIALNISGRLLGDEAFRAKVLEFAGAVDVALCLEVTETAVIDQPEQATEAIAAFREAGLKISIDDYGSGLSSLSYLKLLNADELKVDKSLVAEVSRSQRDRLIMRSTIDLAHSLGMSVVAEGVEDETLASCLTLMGCDLIQGYWLSKALPMADLVGFLDQRRVNAAPAALLRVG